MIPAIYNRRSIRKFLSAPIPEEDIVDIIKSGMKAPSAKNRQPWKYIVARGKAKEECLRAFRKGIAREERAPLLPGSGMYLNSAKRTVDAMSGAPVIVFVVNSLGGSIMEPLTVEERIFEICNIQSIGASVQNMLLAAEEKGISSLWICDIYFAYPELCEWLGCDGQLVAAVAFGYPDEFPAERPRKQIEDVVRWKS